MSLRPLNRDEVEVFLPDGYMRKKDGSLWRHMRQGGPNFGYLYPTTQEERKAGRGFYSQVKPPPNLRGLDGEGI